MTFQSFGFLIFLAGTLALCLALGRKSSRAGKTSLALASLVFYLWGFGRHALLGCLVLVVGSAVSRGAARYLTSGRLRRGGVLAGAVAWHIGVLLVFKYTGFLTGGALRVGWVPLGLSFFTFQQLWFLKEIYTGEFSPEAEKAVAAGDFFLFSFFFPTVSSGPILRPGAFFPQLANERFLRPGWDDAAAGLYAIALGMGKKVLLADSLGVVVDNGYAHLESLTAPAAWLVIFGYTLQLYFDFSGYCDVATGAARLLGVRLPINFDSPYRSLSVGEFWKRWHITLTTFLRECLYFPLGGNKRGVARAYGNILLVFLISGFWHGAGWTFLLWGGIHGLAQVGERLWGQGRERLAKPLRWGLTFLLINVAWVFFRAPDLSAAFRVLSAAFIGGAGLPPWLTAGLLTSEAEALSAVIPALAGQSGVILLTLLYLAATWFALRPGACTIRRMDTFRPTFWRCAAVCAVLAVSILSFGGVATFIYANF